jgi:hypothetical protein
MKHLFRYQLFNESDKISWVETREFLDDLHLKDDGIKCVFQIQDEKVVFYFVKIDSYPKDIFKLILTKDPFFYLLNYMKSIGYSLSSFQYRSNREGRRAARWIKLYTDTPNRWGNYTKISDIFDIQMDSGRVDDILTSSVEIKFQK